MAECVDCAKKLGFFKPAMDEGRCYECDLTYTAKQELLDPNSMASLKQKIRAKIDAILLTTETAPQMTITRRVGLVTASGSSGLLGFKNGKDAMRDATASVLFDLKAEAHSVGANAVLGVTIQYLAISATQIAALGVNSTVVIVAGTAVEVDGLT